MNIHGLASSPDGEGHLRGVNCWPGSGQPALSTEFLTPKHPTQLENEAFFKIAKGETKPEGGAYHKNETE